MRARAGGGQPHFKKSLGPVVLTVELRQGVTEELTGDAKLRQTRLLEAEAQWRRSQDASGPEIVGSSEATSPVTGGSTEWA